MTMPLDTLKLARRLANFAAKQDLKNEIELLPRDLTIRIGGMMIVAGTIVIAATGAFVRYVHSRLLNNRGHQSGDASPAFARAGPSARSSGALLRMRSIISALASP
jgi:hypothetical protein